MGCDYEQPVRQDLLDLIEGDPSIASETDVENLVAALRAAQKIANTWRHTGLNVSGEIDYAIKSHLSGFHRRTPPKPEAQPFDLPLAPESMPEPKLLAIEGHWLVEDAGGCTCDHDPQFGHEPGCGRIPVVDLSTLDGWPGSRPDDPVTEDSEAIQGTIPIPDGPKMLRETLCLAQSAIARATGTGYRDAEHIARLQALIDALDLARPLGPDGKHDDRHTPVCGCDRPEVRKS